MSFGARTPGMEPGVHRTLIQFEKFKPIRMRSGDRMWFRPQDIAAPREVSADTENAMYNLADPAKLAEIHGLVLRRRVGERFNIRRMQAGVVEVEAVANSLVDGSVNAAIRHSTEPWQIINVKPGEIL
jgi:hypothetical protein